MKRDAGYYWVKSGRMWLIAQWDSDFENWLLPGIESGRSDNDFDEISTKKLSKEMLYDESDMRHVAEQFDRNFESFDSFLKTTIKTYKR